ncbi:MAG: ABC-F family ATP-binding cassette domain-containing protein [Clostridiales bacterium]|nr:ABC-F family ATP-binding cassette domain-containing protein [Clostridiales bacterium]
MSILSVQNLELSFGDEVIFAGVTFNVEEKDKIALIGQNGAGKTSLLKIIKGELEPGSGSVFMPKTLKLGYMEQHACRDDKTVWDELLSVFSNLSKLEIQLKETADEIIKSPTAELIAKQDEMMQRFNSGGGLTYKSQTRSALMGLGFSENEFGKKTSALSGGQKSKLSLAKLLLSGADLLLLDEPTNHLDIKALEWLEKFLGEYSGAVIVVSHDRYFLDRVTGRTIEIINKKIYSYRGSYSEFIKKKEALQKSTEEKYKNDLREVQRLEKVIERERQWNREKSIRAAESKEKMLERLKAQMVPPDRAEQTITFDFKPKCVPGEDVLSVSGLSFSFGEKQILDNVEFEIKKGQRVFLIGENGAGKTTLLKILQKQYKPGSGSAVLGANVYCGYFDQVQSDLHLEKTAIDEVWAAFPALTQTKVRNAMAAFLFRGDDVFKRLADCSGGERARVALIKLMLGGYNVLLLDEPTNHLDWASREELEKALLSYSGTMLIVSHDRYFINKLATHILVINNKKVEKFSGNYDDYLLSEIKASAKPVQKRSEKKVNEYLLRKESAAKIRRLKGQIAKTEQKIDAIENEINEIESFLSSGGSYEQLGEAAKRLDEKLVERDALYEEWEKMSGELTTLNK